jgi:hypothetical protein
LELHSVPFTRSPLHPLPGAPPLGSPRLKSPTSVVCYEVDKPDAPVALDATFDELIVLTAERNFDMYETPGDGTTGKARSK